MSDWKIVTPYITVNNVLNPSAEIAGNFAAGGGGAVTRETTEQWKGVYAYRLAAAAGIGEVRLTLNALPAYTDFYCTARVIAGDAPPLLWEISLNGGANWNTAVVIRSYDAQWYLIGAFIPDIEAIGSVRIDIRITGITVEAFVDAVQVEINIGAGLTYTTYCDGDQEGCEWLGLPHASTSQRSAVSRAGGLLRDLADDLDYEIGAMIATGMAPLDLHVDQYAILPGGQLNSIKVLPNILSLPGAFMAAADRADLHARRQGLINALKPDLVPETEEGAQPVLLRYEGAAVIKEIEAHYLGGLEANIDAKFECSEDLAIRLLAPDPFWREIGESAQVLDTSDPATLRYATGRLRATGQWDDLGLVNNPDGGGTINAIAIGPDKKVYFGGNFTGWDGNGDRDYIVRYNPQTAAWETVGGADAVDNIVYALAFGSDGMMYMGGSFGDVGAPVADTARFCAYDYTTDAWSAVGDPTAAGSTVTDVRDIDFLSNGDIVIVGDFTDFSNVGGADYIVQWTGAAPYVLVGAGASGTGIVRAVAVDSNDNIFVGGTFANWAADPNANNWAWYNRTAWASVGGIVLNNRVAGLVFTDDDILYVIGHFTDANGIVEADRIFSWNGTSISALGTGLGGFGETVIVAPDNTIIAGGLFTTAGPLTTDGIAKWVDNAWVYIDADLPGAPTGVTALASGESDPVISNNYDLWVGMINTDPVSIAGSAVATHDGTNSVFPRITISRALGTSAVIKQIRNETTGKKLFINYSLLDGETLTIRLTPTEKSVVSNFFGPRPDAILANSDFGTFELLPGANQITCFVEQVGGAVEASMIWRDTYWSQD